MPKPGCNVLATFTYPTLGTHSHWIYVEDGMSFHELLRNLAISTAFVREKPTLVEVGRAS